MAGDRWVGLTEKQAELEKLEVKDGDIILWRKVDPSDTDLEEMSRALQFIGVNALVLILRPEDSLSVLDRNEALRAIFSNEVAKNLEQLEDQE